MELWSENNCQNNGIEPKVGNAFLNALHCIIQIRKKTWKTFLVFQQWRANYSPPQTVHHWVSKEEYLKPYVQTNFIFHTLRFTNFVR